MDKSIVSHHERQSGRKPDKSSVRPEMQPEWLTYREAETLIGLSRVTIWKLIQAKEVKAARVGKAVRISRQSLQAYMEGRAADASQGLRR
jgi:excisionase family DNA binding protein